MPIYEYTCHGCGNDFEAIQKFDDPPVATCECGETKRVSRRLSLSAFHLQGGGWYKDQYGAGKGNGSNGGSSDGNGAKAESGNGTGKEAQGQAKDGAKGDAKGEAKAKGESTGGAEKAGDSGSKGKRGGPATPAAT